MSPVQAIPFVVVCGIVTILLIRAREIRWWQALTAYLFGFYSALTGVIGHTIDYIVKWFLGLFV